MTIVTALSREDSPPRHRQFMPANCFYCGSCIAAGDIKVPGRSASPISLHFRCVEEFGLTLLRGAELCRRANARGLDHLEWAAIA